MNQNVLSLSAKEHTENLIIYLKRNKIMSKMSSSLKLQSTKKKYNQNDLRRLMQEQKASSVPKAASSIKINSPLAKYPFQIKF